MVVILNCIKEVVGVIEIIGDDEVDVLMVVFF